MKTALRYNFNLEDIAQIAIGAFALAVPISFSEEAWHLGETLPLSNLFMIMGLSLIFLSFYAYGSVFQSNISQRLPAFLFRVMLAYTVTALVVALVLIALDKFPVFSDTVVAIKRLIVIAMPASMGGIFVDSFDKE